MNMFRHELRAYRRSTISWTLALMGLAALFFSMFPTISGEIEEFKKLMEGFPEPLRKALGLSVENLGSILGFYSYIFVYISLFGGIQAMLLGTSVLSKEVRDKTADFLLTKPVSRAKVVTSKLLAALTCLLITNIFYIAAATLMAALVEPKEYSLKLFLLLSVTLFFIQLIFLALGIVVSVLVPKLKSVFSISLGTVFAFFFIGALASSTEDRALRYLSPFKYFDFAYITEHAAYETSFLLTAAAFIVLAIAASYYLYSARDIHAV